MEKIGMTFTNKIKQQEEFVRAISFQKEVAANAYYDAKNYMEHINARYDTELNHLNKLKEQQ